MCTPLHTVSMPVGRCTPGSSRLLRTPLAAFRQQRVRQLVFAEPRPTSVDSEPRATTPDGERSAVASQMLAWLERQIPQLPLRQREVLLLACVERRPQQEIARFSACHSTRSRPISGERACRWRTSWRRPGPKEASDTHEHDLSSDSRHAGH